MNMAVSFEVTIVIGLSWDESDARFITSTDLFFNGVVKCPVVCRMSLTFGVVVVWLLPVCFGLMPLL